MDANDLSSYKDEFLQSAEKNLQQIMSSLTSLNMSSSNQEAVNTIYIAAHSLKGECFAMGYLSTSTACERIEKLFLQLKDLKQPVSQSLIQSITLSLSSVHASLDS